MALIRGMSSFANAANSGIANQSPTPTYQSTFGPGGNWGTFVSSDPQLQAAAQQIMPMYQARLGGLQGPVAEAMRTRGMEQIQSQYGTALRSAMNQAGAQGIRGPAAIAMQQDIRDQMGRATAGYQRDLTIADWDAKRQALADYYNTMQGERGIRMGTPLAQQQLANTQQGFSAYDKSLKGMSGGGGSSGGAPKKTQGLSREQQSLAQMGTDTLKRWGVM